MTTPTELTIPTTQFGVSVLPRMASAIVWQSSSPTCPMSPSLQNQWALVTGVTSGIGIDTAKGLVQRGASVVLLCRNLEKGNEIKAECLKLCGEGQQVAVVTADLSDLKSVYAGVNQLKELNIVVDVLIENAGVAPTQYSETAQGYELAFGTNVLGHFAFRQWCITEGLLSSTARIVCLTGDIYITQSDCTPDFKGTGTPAYSRSKLGNIWIAKELHQRFPEMKVYIVHPGVIQTNLMGTSWLEQKIKGWLLLSPSQGAQLSLIAATQPNLQNGGYYHNVSGLVQFDPQDPAMNHHRSKEMWEQCEGFVQKFIEEQQK